MRSSKSTLGWILTANDLSEKSQVFFKLLMYYIIPDSLKYQQAE